MAGDPSHLLPYRWAPGQSGNPGGWSANRRAARRLRQALDAILADQLPPRFLAALPLELAGDLPPGVTFAEMIALRLVQAAATATNPATVLQAAQLIINAQAKVDALEPRETSRPPTLAASDDRRRSVASQLGVDLEAPEPTENVH